MATSGSGPPQQQPPGYSSGGYRQPYAPTFGPHETYVFQGSSSRETPVKTITVPILLVLIGAAALVSATYAATTQFADIKHSINALTSKIDQLTGSLSERISKVEHDVQNRNRDRWTKSEHELWCAKTEQVNARLGWRCIESVEGGYAFRGARPPEPAPQLNGWRASVK